MKNCLKCKNELPEEAQYCLYCGSKIAAPDAPRKRGPRRRGNGTGTAYIDRRTGRWIACVTIYVNGERHRRTKYGFERKKDALAALSSLSFNPTEEESSNMTFAELYKRWSAEYFRTCSESKETAYEIAYKRCEPLWFRRWRLIKLSEMQAVIDARPSYYTARDCKNLISLMAQYAIRHEIFELNRADNIILPPMPHVEKEAFTEDEILMLWEDYQTGHDFTAYALVMIYTGMRPGELKQMLKENVHLDEAPPYMIGGIKTENGKNRIIPIAEAILPLVRDMYDRGRRKLLEMNDDNFRAAWKEMCARAGTRYLTPHKCRHTFCSELALQGIQPGVIMKIAGHAKYQTTMGYTHIQTLPVGSEAVNKI